LKQGALVSSVAHNSHHIVAVGCDDYSLVRAINHIFNIKGGLAACYHQNLIDLKLDTVDVQRFEWTELFEK